MAEHTAHNRSVVGSTPTGPTKYRFFLWFCPRYGGFWDFFLYLGANKVQFVVSMGAKSSSINSAASSCLLGIR